VYLFLLHSLTYCLYYLYSLTHPARSSGVRTLVSHMKRANIPRACLAYTDGPGNFTVYTAAPKDAW
jgi:hypothetical protein